MVPKVIFGRADPGLSSVRRISLPHLRVRSFYLGAGTLPRFALINDEFGWCFAPVALLNVIITIIVFYFLNR
jgi:hypothetical protein